MFPPDRDRRALAVLMTEVVLALESRRDLAVPFVLLVKLLAVELRDIPLTEPVDSFRERRGVLTLEVFTDALRRISEAATLASTATMCSRHWRCTT